MGGRRRSLLAQFTLARAGHTLRVPNFDPVRSACTARAVRFDFPRLSPDKGAFLNCLRRHRKALGHPIRLIDWDPFERPWPSLRSMSDEGYPMRTQITLQAPLPME